MARFPTATPDRQPSEPGAPGGRQRLIVNADDFGLTRGVNRAVAELFDAGALTSATLMANGPAFADAVALARARPGLSLGCHIVLLDGTPVLPPEQVPTLLGPDGQTFRSSLAGFAAAVLRGQVSDAEIALEAMAQIDRLQSAGLHVTHVDTHKHTHILPAIARPLLRTMEQLGIRAIRNPFEPAWAARAGAGWARRGLVRALAPLRARFLELPLLTSGSIATTDGTLGISATGDLNFQSLHALLRELPEGTWELVCHPGYNDTDLDAVKTRLRGQRDTERAALRGAFAKDSPAAGETRPELIPFQALVRR